MPDLGIEPTGRTVEFSGLFIDRLEDGRVVEMWHLMDNLTLMQQLGVLEQEAAGTA
jgi:predicted ester cyclase